MASSKRSPKARNSSKSKSPKKTANKAAVARHIARAPAPMPHGRVPAHAMKMPRLRRGVVYRTGENRGPNYRNHGQGTAREDRRAHDGMQEGADRGRRRHGACRRDSARQAG